MLIKTYRCNGCGKDIPAEETVFQFAVNEVDKESGEVTEEQSYTQALGTQHYCCECAQELFYQVSQYQAKAKEDTEIDAGKCHALKKAGWTYKQIIEEFGGKYTQTQIKNAIKQYVEQEEAS